MKIHLVAIFQILLLCKSSKSYAKTAKISFLQLIDKKCPHPKVRAFLQSVKEPQFSLGENWGFGVFRRPNKQYSRENGVIPTPICQLFQIHGSIFKPDPSRDCGQASVVCISHCVLLFCICKDTLNRLFALCINIFRTLCLSYLLYQIQILLPKVSCVFLLSLFIRSTLFLTRTIDTFFRCTAVGSLSVPVCSCMS